MTEPNEAAILRVLAHMGLPDDRSGPTTHADGMLTLPAGHYWSIAAEVVAAVRGGRYWATAGEVYRAAGGDGPDPEVARLQGELDATGQELEAARGHVRVLLAERTDSEVSRQVLMDAIAGRLAGRLPLPVAELHGWAEYWQRECADARAERDELEEEQTEALRVLDLVLVDPDHDEDTGEPDDPGSLVDAAETAATRLRLAEDEVVRLAGEVERLSAGEVPLPGAPVLGGAR